MELVCLATAEEGGSAERNQHLYDADARASVRVASSDVHSRAAPHTAIETRRGPRTSTPGMSRWLKV